MNSSDTSPQAEPPRDTIPSGTAIAHFRVERLLGCGGMGEVYLAHDLQLERPVALKLINGSLCLDAERRDRFLLEARAAAALTDQNIVTIYEVGEFSGRPFLAMEYVDGGTLSDRIKTGHMNAAEVTAIARQICHGLQAAHALGIVHRDINPGNILFDSRNNVKIADFGVAQSGRLSGALTQPNRVGTLAYMSPEQVRGEPSTPCSDLFSLGAVMYEMLTGRQPFSGDYEAAILYSIQHEPVQAPIFVNPTIPAPLNSLVLKLLSKDPQDRYQSAQELLNELDREDGVLTKRHRGSPRRFSLATSIFVLAAIVAFLYLNRDKILDRSESAKVQHAVAVLPFENLGSPQDEYFADGMTDAVITSLAHSRIMAIISRTSSMAYKKTSLRAKQIGGELEADYLVTGSVLWDRNAEGNNVRINAALVRVSDDSHLWADSYERSRDHLFSVQAEIADDIRRALKVRVISPNEPDIPTTSLEAYDLFLRGNDYFNRGWAREDISFAQSLYQQALKLDSSFALAYAMLSRCHASMFWECYDRSNERKEAARVSSQRALQLAPSLAEAHWALGYYYYHCELDYLRALEEFNLALQAQPSNADLLNAIAAVERRQGQFPQSAEHFKQALQLDPRSHLKAFDLGLTYGMMRQYRQAHEYVERAQLLAPDWQLPYLCEAWMAILEKGDIKEAGNILTTAPTEARLQSSQYYWWLSRLITPDPARTLSQVKPYPDTASYYLFRAQMLRLLGESSSVQSYADSARVFLEQRVRANPEAARFQSLLGLAYAYLGDSSRAELHGRNAIELLPVSRDAFDAPFLLINLAELYVVIGQQDKAVAQLKYLLSLPGFVSVPYLKLDPLWRPLHKLDSFQQLVGKPI